MGLLARISRPSGPNLGRPLILLSELGSSDTHDTKLRQYLLVMVRNQVVSTIV
jgi:hypothetical protein